MSELKGTAKALDLMQYILDNTDDAHAQDNLPDAMEALRTTQPREDIESEVRSVFLAGYTLSAHHRPYDGEDDRGEHAAWLEYRKLFDPVSRLSVVWCRCGDGIEDPTCKTCYMTDTDYRHPQSEPKNLRPAFRLIGLIERESSSVECDPSMIHEWALQLMGMYAGTEEGDDDPAPTE